MSNYVIYAITNTITTKKYVGSSKDFNKRKQTHLRDLRSGHHHNVHLQRSFALYGEDNFVFSILEESLGSEQDKFNSEIYWIELLSPEYNIGSVGGGDNISNNPNKEDIIARRTATVKAKVALMTEQERTAKWARYGKDNPNWRGGISRSHCACGNDIAPTAKTCSYCIDRTGENNPFYGKTHSEETKAILSANMKARYSDPNYVNPQARPVVADGVVYPSLTACAKHYGKVPATILNRIRSNSFPTFYYLDEMPNDYPKRE